MATLPRNSSTRSESLTACLPFHADTTTRTVQTLPRFRWDSEFRLRCRSPPLAEAGLMCGIPLDVPGANRVSAIGRARTAVIA